jgi:dTDP-4-amino-4,6-dideoxygalactose transaminase
MEISRINCANPSSENLLILEEIQAAITTVLISNEYILGSQVSIFEENFAKFIGVEYCIGVNSGTDALILALRSLGIGKSDEVITTSHTAVATIAAIVSVGATPVFVDIDLETYNIEPNQIVGAITTRTKAIIAVHMYGNPCDMESLCQISKAYSIFLIEDCAQATGAEFKGKKIGSFGDISCFSFYPTKNLGCIGDGGAILVRDKNLADMLLKLRQYGWNSERNAELKSNASRLDELQAAILNVKLNNLDRLNNARINIANQYRKNLQNSTLFLPETHNESTHVFHLYVVKSTQRDALIKHLNFYNIYPGIHYKIPVHLQTAYNDKKRHLPNTEKVCAEILSLPMYPTLSTDQIDFISERIMHFEGKSFEK